MIELIFSNYISLAHRPEIAQAGLSVHGQKPVEHYRLSGLWCIHLYRYKGTLTAADHTIPIRPGRLTLLPPDIDLTYRYHQPRCVHTYAHFQLAPPMPHRSTGSHRLPDSAIKEVSAGAALQIPALFDLLPDELRAAEEALAVVASHLTRRRRAEVKLWDLLWQLSDRAPAPTHAPEARSHPAYLAAIQIIDRELAEPLTIPALARRVGVSHTHLIRLFRAADGTTVSAYLRSHRASRALDLLRNSELPFKVIAASAGIRDAHQFNKLIRAQYQTTPRALRTQARTQNAAPRPI